MRRAAAREAPRFIEQLPEWKAELLRLPKARAPLNAVHVQRATEELSRRFGDLVPRMPAAYEIEKTVAALLTAWRATKSLDGVERRHMRRTPWALFFPRSSPDAWLARDTALLRAWLRWLAKRGRPGVFVALLREYLSAYPVELPVFEQVRRWLKLQLAASESPRLRRWHERCERFGLLERDGTARLIREWWHADLSFDAYLEEAGLARGLEASVFVELATKQLLKQLRSELGRDACPAARCNHAFGWLELNGELRFGQFRVEIAEALLGPFLERRPTPEVQESIRAFLCRTIGDPRIDRSRWQGVPEAIRNVLFRWLVSLSLDDFFRVLDRTAQDEHWKYRKAFWSAYLDGDLIDDAWIVLGPAAARIMRRGVKSEMSGAELRAGTGVQPNHSVLLMRIGGLTIAEWSHMGTCRVWLRNNKAAPKPYAREYTRDQLVRGSDWDQRHDGSLHGTWQAHVAAYIEGNTRIRMGPGEYMPRNRSRR